MTRAAHIPRVKWLVSAVSVIVLSGCASVNFDNSVAKTNQDASDFTQGKLALAQTQEQRTALDRTAAQLLAQPLSQGNAVQLALANSPALQAMMAQNWSEAANAAQSGRIANPIFTFERVTVGAELELGRLLSFGLLDLLTLPQRYGIAQRGIERAQLQLTTDVIDQVTQVRQAWVKAVVAKQNLTYAQQVFDAAQVSAELARRLQSVGNFTKLQRARQQAFYADAATQLATAQHATSATREGLIRTLGLTDDQAKQLKLPDRLPNLPKAPLSPEEVGKMASSGRLDIKLAQSAFESAAKAQGLNAVTSLTDIELGVRRDTVFDNAAGTSTPRSGYEVSVRLPLFDWGGLRRDAMNAQTLAAANRLEAAVRAAGSNLRESYSAYRTAYDVAHHYRDEVVPLRKTISEENVLRYNGMLIGIFELLADTKDQVSSVMAAIAAEQQFWLADAALQASQMGKPTSVSVGAMASGGSGGGEAGH
ncbi:MAG: TolC family protein [Aquabacterium sp.]|nr:TolC family protein [Aquabacterium sp.]